MINPKLFVFVIAVPIFTILTVDFYQSRGFDITEDVTPDQCGVANKKMASMRKLILLTRAFIKLPDVPEVEFNQLCKNATEAHSKIPTTTFNNDRSTIENSFDHYYNCMFPTYTIAYHSCQLTFDDTVTTRNCFFDARSYYSGSPEQANCRETCCPDSLTCGANGVVEKNTLCKNPVLNRTLKDNGCLEACMARFLVRFGKQNCRSGAVRVFEANGEEIEKKYLTDDQCFMKCHDEDES